MANKSSEKSLDEVLSSIKEMITDENPPVLDLTNVISPNGSITKMNIASSEPDMKSFLKLAQENASISHERNITKENERQGSQTAEASQKRIHDGALLELIKETSNPIIKDWLQENLPKIVGEIVESEVRKLLRK